MTESGPSIESARRKLAAQLKSAGDDEAEIDARILLGATLDLDLTGMIAQANRLLTSTEAARLTQFAGRRIAGEPVARIIGEKEFWGLPLQLSSATLVPRPDTETVVELALDLLRAGGDLDRPLRVADLGTGSGAILLALLSELPAAQGFGTDISEDALKTAAANAARAGLSNRATFVACDYASGLAGPFDLIVSNPPYICSADIAGLAREVRNHDPLVALDGGADGLDAYRALIPQAAGLLASGGALVVEAGAGQSSQIQALMAAAGLTSGTAPRADLGGIPRAVAGHKIA
ncbi:peptide chain release factor N(5)-glutamine methyltransferase [Bradyrhizobium sp.]|uniref:peptide chain release factor N(5)-glutamine methyltransferase n=1 Tax=Bradyrhizobium sp. TaxID=376 RepID=UPI002C0B5D4D|nr:peptide chain release factor N(5)-glutamine methyltransferase [Bradyrhizobium sp.]HMM92558.1 peptide chain release factor N(5)-glutamine methyltransferase [Bradyrhizobium sp.]